jgi:VRR-NUC domain
VRELKESDIQKATIDLLKYKRFIVFKHRNVGIYIRSKDRYMQLPAGDIGISDIIACSPKGIFWAIEVKRPGGKLSPEQQDFIDRVNANGGVAYAAYSIDDTLTRLSTDAHT